MTPDQRKAIMAKVAKLVGQYPWRYRRTSPFAYEELSNP